MRGVVKSGFTLVEALVAVTITALIGGAIMLAMGASIQSTEASLDAAIARGLAEQLIDEVVGQRYAAQGAGPYQVTLVASSWEAAGNGRERYNDTDDYNGFTAQPLEGVWGRPLGLGDGQGGLRHPSFQLPADYFDDWREEIEVYYVDESDHRVRLTGSNTSNFRAVEVRIFRDDPNGNPEEVVSLRRVYAYVPAPL